MDLFNEFELYEDNEEFYLDFIKRIDFVKHCKKNDPCWAFHDEEHVRALKFYCLGQNSYGFQWEMYICKRYGLIRCGNKEEGDFIDNNKKSYEFKVSYSNNNKHCDYSFLQIRLWENVDYYYLKAIDRFNTFKSHDFILSKKQMIRKFEGGALKPTHGKFSNRTLSIENIVDEKIELSARLEPYTYEWDLWCDNYLKEDLDEEFNVKRN